VIISFKELKQEKELLEIGLRNEREYEEFLRKNNLKKSWDTWDMFAEQKWEY